MKTFLSLIATIIFFSACHKAETPQSFIDKEYIMQNAPSGAKITIGFEGEGNRFFGESGVNRYFGIFVKHGETIRFTPMGSTMMMGPQEHLEAEQKYLQALSKVTAFKLEEHKLFLYTNDKQELEFNEITRIDNKDSTANNRYLKKIIKDRHN